MQELNLLLQYKEMLKTTISKELKARYKGSVLGFLWTFVNPLLQLAVYAFAFQYIFRMSVPGVSYTLFLFCGITVWTSFSSAIIMGTTTIVANGNLVKKVFFPRVILPVASVTGNIVNLLLVYCIVLPIIWISGYSPNVFYLYVPVILLILWVLSLGLVLILSAAYVFFRDIEHIIGVALMAWMYLTPVIYNTDFIPGSVYHLMKLNPMFPILSGLQRIILFGAAPELAALAYSASVAALLLFIGYALFQRMQRRFAEEL